ncbi:MAG TPA: hypothetical protein VEW42_04715 [Candidatus Eisenbacteria bacterium]|nr:hypothetical protein [Candidatus Eisenbacteria bacterium]
MNPDFEELKNIDIHAITSNPDLGKLNFSTIEETLQKFKEILIELYDLNYQNSLSNSEVNVINDIVNQYVSYIKQLQVFDIGQSDSQIRHDDLQRAILNYYNSSIPNLRPYLTYLRQEADKVSDKADLREQQREATKAKKEFDDLSKQLKSQIETLNKQKKEVETKHGEVANKILALQFDEEVTKNEKEAGVWLGLRSIFYRTLMGQVGLNLLAYLLIFILGDQLKWRYMPLRTKEFFTIAYGIINFSLISLLSYGLAFASKNYSIRENLASVNRHRKNVANTLEDYLATKPDSEVVSQMIKQGTEAMFKHLPLGFVNKNDGAKDSGPVFEVFNPVQKVNNP